MKFVFSFSLIVVFGATLAMAAEPRRRPAAAAAGQLTTKVYRVSDLVLAVPDYSYPGVVVPGMSNVGQGGGGMGGFGGGMGGGMGGMGMGGGFFSVAPKTMALAQRGGGEMGGGMATAQAKPTTPANLRFTMEELIQAVTATIAPESWEEVGGPGTIAPLGGMLIVRQHVDIHRQLGLLLEELRRQGGTITSVTVRAHWVVLDASQLRQLAPTIDSSDWQAGRGKINREALNQFAGTAGAVGQITCFSGQTVHISSGNYRSFVTGAVPVVGQLDRSQVEPALAQLEAPPDASPRGDVQAGPQPPVRHYLAQAVAAAGRSHQQAQGGMMGGSSIQQAQAGMMGGSSNRGVGYQPITTYLNFGILLQITPVLVPDSEEMIIDLQSSVLSRKKQAEAPVDFLGVMPLDRLNLVMQQFMTTLRLPLGQPVLVGGATLQPIENLDSPAQPKEQERQLYLVIEATKQ